MNRFRYAMMKFFFPEVECRRHEPEVVDIQHIKLPMGMSGMAGVDAVPTTVVLTKCPGCKRVGTYCIIGTWTINQVKGMAESKTIVEDLMKATRGAVADVGPSEE